MPVKARNRTSSRTAALALGAFAFAAALTASAAMPQCDHCLAGYYACRANSPDPQPCLEEMWACEMANGCPISLPPDA